MNQQELTEFEHNYVKTIMGDKRRVDIDGVHFSVPYSSVIYFSYKNGSGIVFADNGYLGLVDGNHKYYPLVKISPSYSQESRFNPTCPPNLTDMAIAVKKTWESFTR